MYVHTDADGDEIAAFATQEKTQKTKQATRPPDNAAQPRAQKNCPAEKFNPMLYSVLNHTSPKLRPQFRKYYPEPADNLMKLPHIYHKGRCLPCIVETSARAPFQAATTQDPVTQPLDAISTDTSGPIIPKDPHGNRYLQLLVDSATDLMLGERLRHKSEATKAVGQRLKLL